MRRLAIPLAVLVLGGCGVTPAAAKSIFDPDIGWTTAERQELHLPRAPTRICHRDLTKAQIHLQGVIDRLGDPSEGLRKIFHYRWGSGWYDPCDGGRLHFAVVPSEAAGVAAARALIARRRLTPYVRFNAVRSTWRELGDVQTAFEQRWSQLEDDALVQDSADAERNAVQIDLARPVDPETRAAIRTWALAAPVNVVVHDTDAGNYAVTLL
ncbi:MAG: hypothetical protein JWQ18_3313 [Conexibacter sp.]|nr:hypothetical protein [Conexibacter sp.]